MTSTCILSIPAHFRLIGLYCPNAARAGNNLFDGMVWKRMSWDERRRAYADEQINVNVCGEHTPCHADNRKYKRGYRVIISCRCSFVHPHTLNRHHPVIFSSDQRLSTKRHHGTHSAFCRRAGMLRHASMSVMGSTADKTAIS
jgi:hypothetical protein